MVPHPGASSPPESSAELAEAAAHPPPYSRPTETGYDDDGEDALIGGGDVLYPEGEGKEEPPKRLGWDGILISLIVAAIETQDISVIDLWSEFRA